MAKICAQCGRALGFFERLDSAYCPQCIAERNLGPIRAAREAREVAVAAALEEARAARDESFAAAKQGELRREQRELLEQEGYLVVLGKVVACPVCAHEQFDKQSTLLEGRLITYAGLEWLSRGADACICRRCKHILWFAKG